MREDNRISNIICITNRKLCREDFLTRIEKIAAGKYIRPAAIILREKDLSEAEYSALAKKVMEICAANDVPCILHSFVSVAIDLKADKIHLPLSVLSAMSEEEKIKLRVIGASCHSVDDAIKAEALGAAYITAGHVYDTDCKKGTPGRGPDFLRDVCLNTCLPVYAIGGINTENVEEVLSCGAKGACMMSRFMSGF